MVRLTSICGGPVGRLMRRTATVHELRLYLEVTTKALNLIRVDLGCESLQKIEAIISLIGSVVL